MNDRRRVVITGLGMITPLGTGVSKSWEAVCRGESGIGPLTRFNASHLKCQVAGEVKDFKPLDYLDSVFVRRFDPFIQYAAASAKMAFEDAGLKGNDGTRPVWESSSAHPSAPMAISSLSTLRIRARHTRPHPSS